MLQLFPKPKPALAKDYKKECTIKNINFVWYFSLLSCVFFGIHMLHHARLGLGIYDIKMMPYTIMYSIGIVYTALNMMVLGRLKNKKSLLPFAIAIELLFPFAISLIAVVLSMFSVADGLGITPFAIILTVVCFTLQGQFLLLCTAIASSFTLLATLLILQFPEAVHSPLVMTGFTTALYCLIVANMTESSRVKKFEILKELSANNDKLTLLSRQDHLTGQLNRRAIDNILEIELPRSERFSHPLSILLIDIDDFKTINDENGHVFGDAIIKQVADRIRLHIREVDYVARIGGDEFMVVLVETNTEHAIQVANRMRLEVAEIPSDKPNFKASISIGHALFEGETPTALVEKADQALYKAKGAGKNKVSSLAAF